MMLTRRARHALLGRSRMLIAQRVWHAKALLTLALALIVLTVGPRMSSTVITRRAPHVLLVLVRPLTETTARCAQAQPTPLLVSVRTVRLPTLLMMRIERARAARPDMRPTSTATRVYRARARHTLDSATRV